MPNRPPSRREYLLALASAGTVGIAGCSGGGNSANENGDGQQNGDDPQNGDGQQNGNDPQNGDGQQNGNDPQNGDDPHNGDDEDDESNEDPPEEVGWTVTDPGEPLYTDDPNWRIPAHDTGNTFRNPHAEGPTSDPAVKWSFNTGFSFDFFHQPSIIDGTVYTRERIPKQSETVDSPDDDVELQSALVAINAETGEANRKFKVDGFMRRPTVVEDTVYMGVGLAERYDSVRAYDLHSGELHWKNDEVPRVGGTLAIYPVGDNIVVTSTKPARNPANPTEWSPEMVAFDAATGERLWKYNSPDPGDTRIRAAFGFPTVTETVAHFPETEVPRRLDTGEPAGRFPLPISAMLPDDRLFSSMYIEDIPAGAYDWQDLDERWTNDGRNHIEPTIIDDIIVDSKDERVRGFNAETGQQLWEATPEFEQYSSATMRMHVAGADTVYCMRYGGAVVAVDPTDSTILWELDPSGGNPAHTKGCALADNLLVVIGGRTDGERGSTLYAIS